MNNSNPASEPTIPMNSDFFSHLAQGFNITAPILIVLVLGMLFRKRGWVDDHFVEVGNRLMFYVCMPSLLFLATATNGLSTNEDLPLATFGVAATFCVVLVLWLIAPGLVGREKRGVFVQSAFRSNMGMIGIALCLNAYGDEVLARAGLFVGAMIASYNILSVMVLTTDRKHMLRNLAGNPLLIGVLAGIAWQNFELPLPQAVEGAIGYFARMALPLALICIGASLAWRRLRFDHPDVLWAAMFKLVIIPLCVTAAAVMFGFRGEDLGILFLMVAAPTAMVAFVMAREMTPHGDSAAETIALTTIIMPITITAGFAVLSALGLL
jgi:predicted permease